jgi:predicted RNase H-like HicB family nuclease
MMYAIIMEQAEDGTWTGMAPDVPGLLFAADTREELIAEAPSHIAMHLDATKAAGLPLPHPGTFTTTVEVAA